MNNVAKGRFGEALCVKYLENSNYRILARNWYCQWGEIDIVASAGGLLVFVEVKFVTSDKYCTPVELFNIKKRKHLLRTINFFVQRFGVKSWRADLVCLTKDGQKVWIEHYKDVLTL